METTTTGLCRVCSHPGSGVLFSDWVRDTFTDHDKLRDGEIVCAACQFCFADGNETLTKKLGRDKPQRMRNYSHFVVRGVWTPLSKGEKKQMRELLFQTPEVAIVAVSGQKHLIFRAQPGWWQFEEASTRPCPDELRRLLETVESLYHAGISKDEIETGRYNQKRIMEIGFDRWRQAESMIRSARGTLALDMAIFLAQRPDDQESNGSIGREDCEGSAVANVARDSAGLQAEVREKHLAAVRKQHQERRVHVEHPTLF